jgi:protein N-terminal methyltransferase
MEIETDQQSSLQRANTPTTSSSEPDPEKSKEYWDHVEPTVNGMLGGFSKIHNIDMEGSKKFLDHFFVTRKDATQDDDRKQMIKRCIDCGAGIGRITKHLLLRYSDHVDLLEQSQTFLDRSSEYIGQDQSERIGKKYCSSLQDFIPEEDAVYDCVWLQWVTGYLTDSQLIQFLRRMSDTLSDNGIIVVKDNTTRGDMEDADMNDSSITRAKKDLMNIFEKANLKILLEKRQMKMPKGLYPVYMFALKPMSMA